MSQRRRLVTILAVVALVLGAAGLAVAAWPLIRGCVPIIPRELPSGAAPGRGVEGVAAGAKQVVWGSGSDRVEQLVGLTFWATPGWPDDPTLVGNLDVHGQPATVYRFGPNSPDGRDIAISWFEVGCDVTVLLAPGTAPEHALDYAARY